MKQRLIPIGLDVGRNIIIIIVIFIVIVFAIVVVVVVKSNMLISKLIRPTNVETEHLCVDRLFWNQSSLHQ